MYYIIGVLLFVSFVFLALIKRSNDRVYSSLLRIFVETVAFDQRLKEVMRLSSFPSIILLINYLLTFSICVFLFLQNFSLFSMSMNFWMAILIPLAVLLLQIVPVAIVALLSGEKLPLSTISANSMVGFQLGGILLSILAVVWVFNPQWNFAVAITLVVILGIIQISRLLKNSYLVLTTGVSWYYILLYLCTLEILPLFVAYYYVKLNFMN